MPNVAAQPDDEKVPVIIGFKDKINTSLVKAVGGEIKQEYTIIPAIAAEVPAKALHGLSNNPNIEIIEYDAEVHAMGQTTPWGIERIGAPEVHSTYTGDGIKAAIIDTGVDYTHPDLAANYKGGYDYVNDDTDPMDDAGHGTHVAGTVAAIDNEIGVLGTAPDIDIYALKALDSTGSGSYSDIISAVQWAADNDMDIASMSLGGSFNSVWLRKACDNAYKDGVVLVAAAGNDYGGQVSYPAAYSSVIAVSAIDENDIIASFSNVGPQVELTAPGVKINSTTLGGGYSGNTWDGTSMATPHVTGTIALLLNTQVPANYDTNGNGYWNPAEVRERLHDTATDLGDAGKDKFYGYGLVNAAAAVDVGTTDPEPEPPSPGSDMYIKDISMAIGTKTAGQNTFVWATATVTVFDMNENPLQDAEVYGVWSGMTSDSDIGITGTDGAVTLKSNSIKNPASGGEYTFTVTDVVLEGWTYNTTANVENSDSINY